MRVLTACLLLQGCASFSPLRPHPLPSYRVTSGVSFSTVASAAPTRRGRKSDGALGMGIKGRPLRAQGGVQSGEDGNGARRRRFSKRMSSLGSGFRSFGRSLFYVSRCGSLLSSFFFFLSSFLSFFLRFSFLTQNELVPRASLLADSALAEPPPEGHIRSDEDDAPDLSFPDC